SHAWLNQIPEGEVKTEIEMAKREIENLVQKPCWTIAYPAGYFSEAAQRATREAGHIAGFSTIYGPTDTVDLFALNRVEVLRRDRFTFQFARKVAPLL
ncbi:MAG: polysaccharide deacetylase family protein, partial [Acidobacteriota bacterium]|nr:polysaccharide deacetylase family protein [Acidobacteriota bacterium]